jgi:UPF0755 protein
MPSRNFTIRFLYSLTVFFAILATIVIVFLLQTKINIFSQAQPSLIEKSIIPFPVSVNSYTQIIEEDPAINTFYANTLANAPKSSNRLWNKVVAVLAPNDWYQNLASPVSRIIVIWPGERKEEVTKHIGDIMRWSEADREEFQYLVDNSLPIILPEGKYFPGQYVTHRNATPKNIQEIITNSFQDEVLDRYTLEVESLVPLEKALIIASLLEREASDFENMREVSGVIWNRLFIDMRLQLDATLQYAKGSDQYEPKWWPRVIPDDKYIDSPYNTYKNADLPPAPIANPSAEAILAALNPIVTECLYYFHTEDGEYECSKTYKDHVSKLQALYGRGS